MFTQAPYGLRPIRTRTSSNASFVEPWTYPSQSPTSITSTAVYTWPSSDGTAAVSGSAYAAASYPLTKAGMPTSLDPGTTYRHFDARTMAQRDEEEGTVLFGEQPYGMDSIAHTYPFEQYLDYYWRVFHPTFPVVHRFTFESMSASPVLRAAMIAVGGQYSNDSSVRRKSRILHDRCIKLLEQVGSHV